MKRLLRLPEVLSRAGVSRSYVYDGVKTGRFPKPVKVTERTSAWVESEIQEWIDQRIAERDAGPDSELTRDEESETERAA